MDSNKKRQSAESVRSDDSKGLPPVFSDFIDPRRRSAESVRSDDSKGLPPVFSEFIDPRRRSAESVRSDDSKGLPPVFSDFIDPRRRSAESVRSDDSKGLPPVFSDFIDPWRRSAESVRSDDSKGLPPVFSDFIDPRSTLTLKSDDSKGLPPVFREPPSTLSLKSNDSKGLPPVFSELPAPLDESLKGGPTLTELDAIFRILEQQVLSFVQQQLQRLHRLLASDYPEFSEVEEEELSSREAVLNITLDFLKRMNQEHLAQRLLNRSFGVCKDKLKVNLLQRYSRVFEGVAKAGDSASLTQIYTELYITEGGASEVNQEHEVRHMEAMSSRPATPEITVPCEDLFRAHPQPPQPVRFVLTTGVAGVGKTVLTQKFSLDWAEGRAHQDFHLLFPFTFRELNVLRDSQFSLVELLHHFFSPSKGLCSFQHLRALFIFDGLDECRLPLDFSQTRVLTDPTESTSVHVLLVNLIRGSLLPSARLWITTRPAAANQIPAECVSMVTEVRGFTNPQKEQYFRKRFRDQATVIISHIKANRCLHIMCSIPVFCWILSTVLQKLLEQTEKPELPRTLTQVYVHFLVVQAKVKNIKYHQGSGPDLHWIPETREMVRSLGKLAFEQLQKGNRIFYESDLSECGLDAAAASVYSGVFTQVFREEPGLYQDKVYCFIHLSVQEFLAALHVHQTFFSSGENLLKPPHSSERLGSKLRMMHLGLFKMPTREAEFYCSAVDQALQSPNGHLDLFLRFLLGLSLPTNQRLLHGLLTQTGSEWTNQETVHYIKQKMNEKGLSAQANLNLLHCLNELNDHSLVEIPRYMTEGHLFERSFLLLSSGWDEFDLRRNGGSEEALLKLLLSVKSSTKSILSGCGLSPDSCAPLASVLSSSSLTHLDLSHNDLQDLGVKLLCDGLKRTPCRLETLRLSGCLVSERGGAALASALSSAASHLRELDLSYNHPGPSAELLTALRDQRPLLSVRLDPAGERWMVPGLKKYFCELTLDRDIPDPILRISEDCKNVTLLYSFKKNRRFLSDPSADKRQMMHKQDSHSEHIVLCSTGLTGRCYWEVDWECAERKVHGSRRFKYATIDDCAVIAVGYKGQVHREDRIFGSYSEFWSLRVCVDRFSFYHNDKRSLVIPHSSSLPHSPFSPSGRVGVFLDSEAGSLSFYRVLSDGKLSHLHTFCSTFTEPLFLGLSLNHRVSVSLCERRGEPLRRMPSAFDMMEYDVFDMMEADEVPWSRRSSFDFWL
ncbi:NACHT, LRR and PYD domains-containing protein 3-like isoform X4 [Boleophthalmus pectinirostris]|uniref:NACHT, LRR and PYD domains-containing protein 3-like isoform X4 n=1 Tax=Boleophthalmus pectinirostris TaxID=150288 RepID=UPI002431FBB4|nr:NACHT, LRR and PYD domains-containing protein 3-like isoform X4 [Boleophthalmus pectinirostris]XP_055017212.1 NACHT, LRR and PYD domains-containing protein 3-like isoform X4 [Boleophthalmus pectinirostris]